MAITYSPSDDKITVTGYSEATPCTFEDIYQADKAGTLTLIDRDGMNSTDANPVNNTYNLCPADEKLLGGTKHDLYIIVENWDATSATVKLIGTNENDDSLTEDINITGNGTYYASSLFKTLTQTQITAFTGTSFDYSLVQGQWGTIWKTGSNSYYWKNTKLIIGDGSTATYFIDTNKQITIDSDVIHSWGSNYYIYIDNNAYFRLGKYINEAEKRTDSGCQFLFLQTNRWFRAIMSHYGADVHILSCEFLNAGTSDSSPIQFGSEDHRFWNCIFQKQWFQFSGKGNIYNLIGLQVSQGLYMTGTFDKITFLSGTDLFRAYGGTYTYIEPYSRGLTYIAVGHSFTAYIIDADTNTWTIRWYRDYPTGYVYRQYTFNLKVIDKENNSILGASVKVWDKDNNLLFSESTDENGIITEQILTYKKYEKDVENCVDPGCSETIVTTYSPHIIEISKAGYQTYKKKFTLDKEIDWTIGLKKISINIDNEVVT